MPEDIEYNTNCEVCGVQTSVIVFDIDEKPIFCPMCGEEAIVEQVQILV